MGPGVGGGDLQAPGAAELGAGGEPHTDRRRRVARLYRLPALHRGGLPVRLPARPRHDGSAARRRRHAAADRHRLLCLADARVQPQRRRDAVLGRAAVGAMARGGAGPHRLVGAGGTAGCRRPLCQAHHGAADRDAGAVDRVGRARAAVPVHARPMDRPGGVPGGCRAARGLARRSRLSAPQVCGRPRRASRASVACLSSC